MIAQLDKKYLKTRPSKVISRMISYLFFEGRPLTTKGRWINSIVFMNLSILKKIPWRKKINKPIFIIGTGRSGSTILGKILSMHYQVGFLNEPKAIWHSIYPEEDVIGNYSNSDAKYRLGEDDAKEGICNSANRIYRSYLKIISCKRVVDKYPELIFRVPFINRIFPDAKFIFLVRNGNDTSQSIDLWSKRLGKKVGDDLEDWWGVNNKKWNLFFDQIILKSPHVFDNIGVRDNITADKDKAVLEWIFTSLEGISLIKEMPEQVMMVKYEDLTSYPAKTIQQIFEFCDLPLDEKVIKYGCSVLEPVPKREKIEHHPALKSLFENTMSLLNYEWI